MKQLTVNEYRKKHRRCKTCKHAFQGSWSWTCKAKGRKHTDDQVATTWIKGWNCKLYEPILEKE